MGAKQALFLADSLDNAHKLKQVLSQMGVEAVAGSSAQALAMLAQHPDLDLVIFELGRGNARLLEGIEGALSEDGSAALLIIAGEDDLADLRLPMQVRSDFVMQGATPAECALRVRQLLWPGNELSSADLVTVDSMTLNLATYQVEVAGEPLDLTYLEYALLAFLCTHPGRTYSRDALLRRVWGFDYYGGSRTVDVHVRRVRAKLGPELANRLQTVRGVGYLWNA